MSILLTIRYLLVIIFLIFGTFIKVVAHDGSELDSKGPGMTLNQRIEMYSNVSTASSYIKIRVSDLNSKKIVNMVVENAEFARFMASKYEVPKESLERFYKHDYIELMLKSDGELLDLDIEKFENYLAKIKFGSKSVAKKYLKEASFGVPMTFRELGVISEDDLITKYFFFDKDKNMGSPKPGFSGSHDPRFIALLIDLGYVVSRGDIAPILRIYKPKAQ